VAAERPLAEQLARAVLRWEGVLEPTPLLLENTWAYLHLHPASGVHTAGTARARTVRVQVMTPAGRLNPEAQRGLIREATDIVVRLAGDPTQATRTWVLLTEAAPGGWGIAGTVPSTLQQLQEAVGAQPAS
jgi:phenylpyruvate tautomerase PptA (4-oxalocrotonate tautomerase family)